MELGELAVKKALDLGMDEAEAFINKTKKIDVQFASEIQNMKTTESLGLGLRVVKGKKMAMQATSILNKKEINSIVEKAVKIAKVSPEDDNWKHFNKDFGKTSIKSGFDKKLVSMSYEDISDTVLAAINKASEDDRKVLVTRGVFSITIGEHQVINNYSDSLSDKYTLSTGVVYTKAIEGGDSSGTEGRVARSFDKLGLNEVAIKAADKALRYVGAKPIDSEKMPVIFKNKAFAQILGLMLGFNISAENIQKGRSTFSTKLDQQIAQENINVVDDGTLKDGVFSRSFDTDGTATQRTEVIKDGFLKNILYDSYTALKANKKSTGNAYRQYWTYPSPTTNNLILSEGTTTLEDMIKDTKKGIFIENTIGHWLSRPTSGDLNATITHGMLIEDGELTKPVTNVVIGGNFFDILMSKIEVIGKDLDHSNKVYTPSVKISEMTIAGK